MAKYDGLIIPRSYNDYINKSDPLGVSQALQLTGVMDDTPIAGSSKPVKSSGLIGLSAVDVVETGNMHPVTSNAVANAMSYSTSEVNTGKTWIDGKPIYRKVIESISQSGGNTEDVTALNIASLVNLSFIILADANNKTIIGNPIYYDGNALMGINYNNTTKQIKIFTSSATDLVNKPINYILEYTKTIN